MDFCFAEGLSVEWVEHYLHILNKLAERMRAIGFTCKGCPAFLDERMIELVNRSNQGRGGLTNLPSSH
jgi:hypothetical protein